MSGNSWSSFGGQLKSCLGLPLKQGTSATRVNMALPYNSDTEKYGDGSQSYGFDVRSNLFGPLTVGGRYELMRVEIAEDDVRNGHQFAVLGAYELPLPLMGVSVCPMMEPGYFRFSIAEEGVELTMTRTSFPLGLGIGYSIMATSVLSITPYAVPQFVLGSMGMSLSGAGAFDGSDSESYNAFGSQLGLTVGFDRFFLSGGWSLHKVKVGEAVERYEEKR